MKYNRNKNWDPVHVGQKDYYICILDVPATQNIYYNRNKHAFRAGKKKIKKLQEALDQAHAENEELVQENKGLKKDLTNLKRTFERIKTSARAKKPVKIRIVSTFRPTRYRVPDQRNPSTPFSKFLAHSV